MLTPGRSVIQYPVQRHSIKLLHFEEDLKEYYEFRTNATCEMKSLRKAVGVIRLDRQRNDNIRNRTQSISCIECIEREKMQRFCKSYENGTQATSYKHI